MAYRRSEIPEKLIRILHGFTTAVLQNKPVNIPRFAVEYFTGLMKRNEARNEGFELTQRGSTIDEDEIMDNEFAEKMVDIAAQMPPARRVCVTAEPYNPDEDENFNDGDKDECTNSFYEKTPEQIERLMEVCRKIVIFSDLNNAELIEVINAMFIRTVLPEEDVIKQYEDGDNFYIIDSGKFEAKIDDMTSGNKKVVMVYDNEGFFGELALMYNSPRSATVTAVTGGILWTLSRQSFRKHVLNHAARRRRAFDELLQSVPILKDLTSNQRASLADDFQGKCMRKGEIIFREGDPSDTIYFIMDGMVVVKKNNGSNEEEVKRISKGGCFGELALLSPKPRAASVYAATDVTLAMLSVQSFERLLGPYASLMKNKTVNFGSADNAI
ncbi:hypothetical protein Aperf_G00000069545 [Anoplocephala perfoliata]